MERDISSEIILSIFQIPFLTRPNFSSSWFWILLVVGTLTFCGIIFSALCLCLQLFSLLKMYSDTTSLPLKWDKDSSGYNGL